MTYPQGQTVDYGYDDANAVTDVEVSQPGWSTLVVADYEYDNMGRVTDVVLSDGGSTNYQYDGIGRLDTHTLTDFNVTTLDYNPASQIVLRSVTDSAMQTALLGSSPASYVPNALNQYSSVDSGNPLDYDDNGNLTAFDGWSYGYDAHNRLASAIQAGGPSLDLDYDPNGRLISTTLDSSTTDYVYSGNQLIAEYDPAGNPINLYVYAPGSDIPIARFSGSNGLNDVQYLRADERGSIVVETDGTVVLESHQYDVYGVPLEESVSLFRYTGQIQLKGTELYHYKARAYHPGLGRFLQTDPIGYDDGMNMYAYVGNDPVNVVDSTGRIMEVLYHEVVPLTGKYHTSIRFTPDNQKAYANNPNFKNIDKNGKRYSVLSAGPERNKLVSDVNRESDLGPQEGGSKISLPNGVGEDAAFSTLSNLDSNYSDNLDYDLFPANDGARSIFIPDDGYNSNSYVSGLLDAAGIQIPKLPGVDTSGYDKPVPADEFKKP